MPLTLLSVCGCSQIPGFWVGGTLSPAVGTLTSLTLLDLNSNNMTGPMPAEIVNLNQVQVRLAQRGESQSY